MTKRERKARAFVAYYQDGGMVPTPIAAGLLAALRATHQKWFISSPGDDIRSKILDAMEKAIGGPL